MNRTFGVDMDTKERILNLKYENKQLKAENERLKEDKNYLIKAIANCHGEVAITIDSGFIIESDEHRYNILMNLINELREERFEKSKLKQQLKEKDEEIASLNRQLSQFTNRFSGRGFHKTGNWGKDLELYEQELCKSNTKQVCEKIRNTIASNVDLAESRQQIKDQFNIILDKIEKGEE